MMYFTPERYVRGNSENDDEVDRVEKEWEAALKEYGRHYKKIERHLPAALRLFNSEQCLHDAEIDGPVVQQPFALPWSPKYVLIAARQLNTLIPEFLNTVAVLHYTVAGEPIITRPVRSPVFHAGQPIWLYEEVDLIEPGLFQHEILVSDGRVISIRFRDFHYDIVPLPGYEKAAKSRRRTKKRSAVA
jgi:hypothetical protein